MDHSSEFDLGPLSWVKGEIDLALERADEALQNYARSTESSQPEEAQLKFAQTHLHQAYGALSIVGLDGITEVVHATEQAVAALDCGQLDYAPSIGTAFEQVLRAIRRYLDDLIAGVPNQPLRLLPVYRELLTASGVTEISASDLFFPDLTLRPPARQEEPPSLDAKELRQRLKSARQRYQHGMLAWLKGKASGLSEMRDAVAAVESTQGQAGTRAFWWITLALLEGLSAGGIADDNTVKRLCAKIDLQMRKLLEGSRSVAERLLRDVLYRVALSTDDSQHIEQVRGVYRLKELLPDAIVSTAPTKPVLRAMRDTLIAAKEDWNRYSAGTAIALPQFHERAMQLISQVRELGQVDLSRLIAALAAVANMLRKQPLQNHNETVALEVATALLLAENALDGFDFLDVEFAHQVDIMTGRLAALLRGETLPPQDAPQLGEMARRAQERLLMSQVAREILNNLGHVEQVLDRFFRDPSSTAEFATLDKPLKQVKGALAILGEERAEEVLSECQRQVAEFGEPNYEPRTEDFETLAKKLSGLGFFIEALQHGPADIDAIINPDSVTQEPGEAAATSVEASLADVARDTQALAAALQDKPGDEALRGELKQALATLRDDASLVANAAVESQASAAITALESGAPEEIAARLQQTVEHIAPLPAAPLPSVETTRLAQASSEVFDAELLAIFIEEAHEVLATIATQMERSIEQPHDHETLTVIRRAFHTLKGSGRMVGLAELAEAAFAVERVMTHWLQLEQDATAELHELFDQALTLFSAWVVQLETTGQAQRDASELIAACARIQSDVPEAAPPAVPAPEEAIRLGEISLAPALYGMYVAEARSHIATLEREFGLLQRAPAPPAESAIRAAHTLAGISGTIGIKPINVLAQALELALTHWEQHQIAPSADERELLSEVLTVLTQMLETVIGQRMPQGAPALVDKLAACALPIIVEPPQADVPAVAVATTAQPLEPTPESRVAAKRLEATAERRVAQVQDKLDEQLLPVFLEEGQDLLRAIGARLRDWQAASEADAAALQLELRRLLHTLKGSARMAGAMSLGELVHGLESRIEEHGDAPSPQFLEEINGSFDRALVMLDGLRERKPAASANAPLVEKRAGGERLNADQVGQRARLRVRADLVDELVNSAGEMAIARSRIEGDLRTVKTSLLDLTESVIRLRNQLREIEIQAESQMQSRFALAHPGPEGFDPLEMDRFTRFQELTRMMAETVNDVSTVQQNLLQNLNHANAAVVAQARLNRDLSKALMSVRMVPFNSIADRLYHILRQTAKELGKPTNLDIRGGHIELDRSVLEKVIGPIEHLLRNAVIHGVENRDVRQASGKPELGQIILTLSQEGNEIEIELADDGPGLDFAHIRAKAVALGLLGADEHADTEQLTQFIFVSGFSTAQELTELAGRGVGMDVVKAETSALGGRIAVSSEAGVGTRFQLYLPLTLTISQCVLVRVADRRYALPAGMVEQVQELKPAAIENIRAEDGIDWQGKRYPWHYLSRLLGDEASTPPAARRHCLLLIKGGAQQIALEVDELVGNQEVVVKNIGPQLARVIGITGATVLGDGEIALIVNPIALAGRAASAASYSPPAAPAPLLSAATVMVVDDSLTVRKVTGRLLEREGYQVLSAKDGVDALEQMMDIVPDVLILDIEMPRMDGFDLTRHLRADPRLHDVPIIMVTSRTAEKHRDYARSIGVQHYLGKPYDEDELLRLIRGLLPLTVAA